MTAKLTGPNEICLSLDSPFDFANNEAKLIVDGAENIRLFPVEYHNECNNNSAKYHLPFDIELGHSYFIHLGHNEISLDVSEATSFHGFEGKYYYSGFLGVDYQIDRTLFKIWAPLASHVSIKIKRKNDVRHTIHDLKRGDRGVYSLMLDGDYEEAQYVYLITNSERTIETLDPYALSGGPNGEYSSIINWEKVNKPMKCSSKPITDLRKAIIYECNVRDMTISPFCDVREKGKFIGLVEKERKTKDGSPAGFDYIKGLGVTHVQLMPIFDFATVDELNPISKYNWGYDPMQYFIPEGSYCSNPFDPYKRVNECIEMINAFHAEGMFVSMDVVYNHIYKYQTSTLEKIVPNYYFRKSIDGALSSCSGCGNDLATERPMIEKYFIDVSKHWVRNFGIDCFRMDLMGLEEITFIKKIEQSCKEINESFRIYGEGWDMSGGKLFEPATIGNAKKTRQLSFFNDIFREGCKKYCAGVDISQPMFEFFYRGSDIDVGFHKSIFLSSEQSINYVECHDDKTYFDVLSDYKSDIKAKKKTEISKFSLAVILCSRGVPFIHSGQEIGASKFGKNNTYNLPDIYNRFQWDLLDERESMYRYVRGLIRYRSKFAEYYALDDEEANGATSIKCYDGIQWVEIKHAVLKPYSSLILLFNPHDDARSIPFDSDKLMLMDGNDYVEDARIMAKNVLLPGHSALIMASISE